MFIYEMGIVDFFNGMMLLEDYVYVCCPQLNKNIIYSPAYHEINNFLIKCFVHLKSIKSNWVSDISEIAISAIPRPATSYPYRLLCFKQNNNGSSFLISEMELLFDNKKEENDVTDITNNYKNNTQKDLLRYFDESLELAHKLIYDSYEKCNAENKLSISNNENSKKSKLEDEFEKIG